MLRACFYLTGAQLNSGVRAPPRFSPFMPSSVAHGLAAIANREVSAERVRNSYVAPITERVRAHVPVRPEPGRTLSGEQLDGSALRRIQSSIDVCNEFVTRAHERGVPRREYFRIRKMQLYELSLRVRCTPDAIAHSYDLAL